MPEISARGYFETSFDANADSSTIINSMERDSQTKNFQYLDMRWCINARCGTDRAPERPRLALEHVWYAFTLLPRFQSRKYPVQTALKHLESVEAAVQYRGQRELTGARLRG